MMKSGKLKPSNNKPTIGAALAAFATALIGWGVDLLPASVPDEVVTSGQALAIALVAVVIGQLTQHVGDNAPWAAESHAEAMAKLEAHVGHVEPDDGV